MNLIEALNKYEKVTCDEIIDVAGYDMYDCAYMSFNKIFDILEIEDPITGSVFKISKAILFSNSYREWKEVTNDKDESEIKSYIDGIQNLTLKEITKINVAMHWQSNACVSAKCYYDKNDYDTELSKCDIYFCLSGGILEIKEHLNDKRDYADIITTYIDLKNKNIKEMLTALHNWCKTCKYNITEDYPSKGSICLKMNGYKITIYGFED